MTVRTASSLMLAAVVLAAGLPGSATAEICRGFGPQTPRDIASPAGENRLAVPLAPAPSQMNLCNIHTHTQAEHKGPGFAIFAGEGEHGGFRCAETASLSEAELAPSEGTYGAVEPGDTIEVHWVHTSCAVQPGEGLGSCLSESCGNPTLRVEAQVFLVVNDENALDFADFAYGGTIVDGFHQARSLPEGTGEPVVFLGSTTGPSFSDAVCSPLLVTSSVRPNCAKLDIGSLHRWAEAGNVFNETHSHGVRPLVSAPELLAPIN